MLLLDELGLPSSEYVLKFIRFCHERNVFANEVVGVPFILDVNGWSFITVGYSQSIYVDAAPSLLTP